MIVTKDNLSPANFIGVQGENIISFGSGEPDLPPPNEVYQILPDYTDYKYGLIQGQKNLRNALSKQYPNTSAENFVITNGASEALDLTLRVISHYKSSLPKKILITKPFYYSYPRMIEFAGLEPLYLNTNEGLIDPEDFRRKVTDCRAVIINSPSNPTGRVESIDTLKEIESLTSQYGVYVLSDEVYKDLIYIRENYLIQGPHVVTINSFSKTYAMCGFRVGYLYSLDNALVRNIIEMKTHTSMNTNILGQNMALEATKVHRSFIDKQLQIWQDRRNFLYSGLKGLGLNLWNPEGAFYMLPEIDNARDFVWDMYTKYNVISYLGDWFGAPGRVRFSYALDRDKIEEGLSRMNDYLHNKRGD